MLPFCIGVCWKDAEQLSWGYRLLQTSRIGEQIVADVAEGLLREKVYSPAVSLFSGIVISLPSRRSFPPSFSPFGRVVMDM